MAIPIVLLGGLIATNGFTSATPGVILVGLLIGLVVASPIVVPVLLLLYLQTKFAGDRRWRGLWLIALLLTVVDGAAILMLAQWAIASVTPPLGEQISIRSVAASLALMAIMIAFGARQFGLARKARLQHSDPVGD